MWKGLENLKNAMKKVEKFEKGRFEEENTKNKIEERKEEKVKSRGRRVQERGIAREIYSKVVIWIG